jgi:hypothetical protein
VGYGDAVPKAVATFTSFGNPSLNDAGQIAFTARVGDDYENVGIYLYSGNGITSLARTGDPAPNTGGHFKTIGFGGIALNNQGTVVFEATFNGDNPGDGLFSSSNGTLKALVLRGQPVPTEGGTFQQFSGLALNDRDQLAFTATFNSKVGTEGSGLFVSHSGLLKTISLAGQTAGYPSTGALGRPQHPSINENGTVAFVDTITSHVRGITYLPNGVFLTPNGTLPTVPVAIKQKQISANLPVLAGNFLLPGLFRTPQGTDSLLFIARDQATKKNGLWLYSLNTLTSLVKEGDPASIASVYSFIGNLSVASSGDFAFVSNLKGNTAKAGIFVSKINF